MILFSFGLLSGMALLIATEKWVMRDRKKS